jgi:adenine-specific DNA-methyltransferase
MTAVYEYYELLHFEEGIGSGLKYKTASHVTLGSIANNEPPEQETLFDQPYINNTKTRVSGPFTVEAVPSLVVKSPDEITKEEKADEVDNSIARSGETLRQIEWKDELLRTGIRAKGGKKIEFARLETLPGTRNLHLDGGTKEDEQQRIVVSFGPEHSPLDQRQVELALEEARTLVPSPNIIVFAAFHFDPEAAKDIDELNWPGKTIIKVQMNGDLLTDDLKKKRSSNESFWMIGQPDIVRKKLDKGEDKGKYVIEVKGFDYYNPVSGNIESGGTSNIAMWLLDTDYDGRSLYPHQVFFPISGEKEGWSKLSKNLKAEIDEDLIEAYKGTVSLPFEIGKYKRAAVKIIDDRGIESLRIINLE